MFPPRADILKALRMGGGDSFYMLGKVEICGVNTTKLPTLTAAETDALLHRAKDGDAAAREKARRGQSAAGAVGHPALFPAEGKTRTTSFRSAAWGC